MEKAEDARKKKLYFIVSYVKYDFLYFHMWNISFFIIYIPEALRCGPWARQIYPCLVLVQPRKTCPCLTERLLMGHKESNQTKTK